MTKVSKKVQTKKLSKKVQAKKVTVVTLIELVKLVANKNLTTSSNRGKSTNDYLVEILFDKKQSLTRPEIVEQVLASKFEAKLEAIASEAKSQDEAIEMAQKLYKTAKNSVDTSLSNSNNNSSFSYNISYDHLKIVKAEGKYSIVAKKA